MKLSENGIILEEALLAYANNELTAEQKQEMEKLLQADPFAQDALEGLQQAGKASTATAVLNINKKVREKAGIREGKGIKMHWTAYAWAAVVFGLLIGIGFVMVNYMAKPGHEIAMNQPAKEESVNLLEQKQEQAPAMATEPGVTDSTVVTNETANTTVTTSAVQPPALETKTPAQLADEQRRKAEADRDDRVAAAAPVSAPVVAPRGAAAPAVNSGVANEEVIMSKSAAKASSAGGGRVYADSLSAAELKRAEKNKAAKKDPKILPYNDGNPSGYTISQQGNTYNIEQHGAIEEKVPAEKVVVITIDDATKSFNMGDYKKSGEQFSEILKQQPNNADALYFGGISDYINGNTKRSEKNFDKLLKEGTKFSEGSKWYKANILLKKGKKDEAKKLLDDLANGGGSYKERAIKKKAEMEF